MQNNEKSLAEMVVERLRAHGVSRIFGVPGGGSSLQVIDAAARNNIPFTLTRSEASAIIMASVTGELSGAPGAALTTKGPGIANGANGLAYAMLDRAPAIILADGFDPPGLAYQSHQVFDQAALVAPVTKAQSRLEGDDPAGEMRDLLACAMAHPRGPVYCEFTAARGRKPVAVPPPGNGAPVAEPEPDPALVGEARKLLAGKSRPVVVAGLQTARDPRYGAALRRLIDKLQCPVLPSYKAKGVVPDNDPGVVGLYVGGAGEQPVIDDGDLLIMIGADPVEFALQPWRYPDHPVIELTLHPFEINYFEPQVSIVGALDLAIDALAEAAPAQTGWTPDVIMSHRLALRERLRADGAGEITPQHVIDAVCASAPAHARISVDAGAHMLGVMAFWQADQANDVLISNGLATMAFALPAAIAAALHEPDRPVIAFTGDGGLAMCLGELATAAQERCNLTVVVFNDSALSMIGVKQASSGYEALGVDFSESDFAAVATGLGLQGFSCRRRDTLEATLREAFAHSGPSLVDIRVDPTGYRDQVKRLRG